MLWRPKIALKTGFKFCSFKDYDMLCVKDKSEIGCIIFCGFSRNRSLSRIKRCSTLLGTACKYWQPSMQLLIFIQCFSFPEKFFSQKVFNFKIFGRKLSQNLLFKVKSHCLNNENISWRNFHLNAKKTI
jgi:hypothetical protein